MPYIASIGTYLPCWGAPLHRVAGDDEDAITLAVEAGRAALIASGAVERVVLVTRDMPLMESSNAAVLLAGLGLDPELEVDERLGGAPATLDALSYDCAPQSDGAAALVLAADEVVDRFTDRPVWIRGVGLGLDSVMHQHKPDMTTLPATTRAAKQAFSMASMTPADVDVTEIHDFFTGIEIISYEDLGFAERFGGYKLVEAEVTSVGGALPVNPSGGLKAKGHPPGATGVAQCVELFAQLRGEAVNEVDGARVALAHNIGGPTEGSAGTVPEGPAKGPW